MLLRGIEALIGYSEFWCKRSDEHERLMYVVVHSKDISNQNAQGTVLNGIERLFEKVFCFEQ